MNAKALSRSMRLSVAEGGLATAMGSLFSGVFLTGFALAMGASRLQIGILFALPALSGVAQLMGSYWIERGGSSKPLCLWGSALSRLLFLPVLLVPLALPTLRGESKVWWIVALMALSHLLSSLAGVAWLSWIKALIPVTVRVPFFGKRNLVNNSLSFVVCLLGGATIDYCTGVNNQLLGFALVFGVAVTCGLVSWALLSQIPGRDLESHEAARPSFSRMLAAPLREPNFRRMTMFYVAWNLAVNLAAPFIPVFFLQKLGLPFWYIIILNTLSSLMGLVANNFWTRLAQRFGIKPVVLVATIGDALFPLALVFINEQWAWTLLLVHVAGIFNTPIAIGPDSFLLKLTPEKNASPYMAVFRAMVGPATAIAAIVGGWLAGSIGSEGILVGDTMLGGLRLVFLISFTGRLASLLLLAKVTEPSAHSLRYVARVFQRSRRRARFARVALAQRLAAAPKAASTLVNQVSA